MGSPRIYAEFEPSCARLAWAFRCRLDPVGDRREERCASQAGFRGADSAGGPGGGRLQRRPHDEDPRAQERLFDRRGLGLRGGTLGTGRDLYLLKAKGISDFAGGLVESVKQKDAGPIVPGTPCRVCGNPSPGGGRKDRMYCSDATRTKIGPTQCYATWRVSLLKVISTPAHLTAFQGALVAYFPSPVVHPGCPPGSKSALVTLYNLLIYWSGREDLNLRPPEPHSGALPGCATPRFVCLVVALCFQNRQNFF